DRTYAALQHMQNDATLFGGNFAHSSDDGFVRGLTSLFDVVGTIPKPKAIVLFSGMRDVPYEEDFRNLAALAAASRSVVYPVDIQGLDATDVMVDPSWVRKDVGDRTQNASERLVEGPRVIRGPRDSSSGSDAGASPPPNNSSASGPTTS